MVRLLNVYSISAFIALGGMLIGFDISSTAGVVGTQRYQSYYDNPLGVRQGGITGAMAAGSVIGALSSSALGDWLSRKVTIQLGTVLWCIGASLQASSTSVTMLVIGRMVSGLCIGMTSALVPIYQSEIAPHKIRGRIVSLQHCAIALGMMIQYFIQYGCSFLNSTAAFRLPWALQTVPAVLLFIGLFWLPLSPRWLATKGRWDDMLRVLAFLRTSTSDINDPLVLAEYKEIEEQMRIEREELSSYRELFSKKMRKRLFLGMAVMAWSQLCGFNSLLFFIVYIFDSATISNPLLAASILYIMFLGGSIPTYLWNDRWGRRTSLLVGALSLAFWMYLIGGLFARFGEPNRVENQPFTWLVVDHPAASRCIQASSYLAAVSFAMSFGAVKWIYCPEIMPLRIRTKGVGIAVATNWATNLVLAVAMPALLRTIRWRVFFIFGSFGIAAFIHIWLKAPETKQRTLEEMDEIFEHGEPVWRSFTGVHYSARLDALAKEIERDRLNNFVSIESLDGV
ncbi:general substrate transporter [Lipomyces chichibuensis]|uniref:general substrate transporter n=1 Tax=Lipomyces chichibuensis TaxID=1546026 RepID=UPI00334323EF